MQTTASAHPWLHFRGLIFSLLPISRVYSIFRPGETFVRNDQKGMPEPKSPNGPSHEHNTEYHLAGKTPKTAIKCLNARVLRMAGCAQIKVSCPAPKGGTIEMCFEVPSEEPDA